jgi:hypothetical protein
MTLFIRHLPAIYVNFKLNYSIFYMYTNIFNNRGYYVQIYIREIMFNKTNNKHYA